MNLSHFFSKKKTGQPIDCKRDQFRKYIESKGVIDTITKVLIKLLEAPVKPEHPIDFIRDNLGPTLAEKHRIESLEQQLSDYKQEVTDLKTQIEQLKTKVNEKDSSTSSQIVENGVGDTKHDDVKVDETKASEAVNSKCNGVSGGGGGGAAAEAEISAEKKIAESEKAATPVDPPTTNAIVIETSEAEKADVGQSNTIESTPQKDDDGNVPSKTDTATVPIETDAKETTDEKADSGATTTEVAVKDDK